MKNLKNKKGFTIVELVIVIAVIAILAAVLIPTFSGVIEKANESKAMQEATNAYKEAYALAISDGVIANNESQEVDGFTFTWTMTDGSVSSVAIAKDPTDGYTYTWANGKITATK